VHRFPNAQAAAHVIQHGEDHEVAELLTRVRQSRDDPKPLLKELAGHRDPVVRGWALSAIGDSIGVAGLDILTDRAKRDRDSDVRDIAIQELLDLDLDEARQLAPIYRRKLRSKDLYEPATGMWALAAVGDSSSLDAIRTIEETATNAIQKNTAAVVSMILEGRSSEILAGIRSHNHDLMPWLTKAARILGTPEAQNVLQECAASTFDEECRNWCRKDAEYLAARRTRKSGPRGP